MKIGIMLMEKGRYTTNMKSKKKNRKNRKKDIVSIVLLVIFILLGIFNIIRYKNYIYNKEKYDKIKDMSNNIDLLEKDLVIIQELDSNIEKISSENNDYSKKMKS